MGILFCAVAVILLLAGSRFTGAVARAASEGPLKFTIWSDEETYVRKVVDAYNALKGKEEILLEVIPNAEHEEWLQEYSDDYGVDLIGLRGNSQLLMLQREGKLAGLSGYIQQSSLDVSAYGNMFNEIVYEGEYYALPTRNTCWVLYYNKELFDAAGVAYPGQQSWEDYLELANQLTSEGQGAWGGYFPPWIYNMMAIQQGYYLVDDDLEPVKESLAFLQELYGGGSHMPYDAIKDSGDDCRYEFERGTVAMMVNGEWLVNMLLEDEAKGADISEWGIAPLPIPEGVEENTTIGMYQFAGVTSVCRDPDRAFDFLKFLCGEEGALIYARNAIIPAYSNGEIQQAYMETVGKEQASVFFEAKKIQEQPMWYGYDQLLSLFNEDARAYLEGQYTVEETMERFQEQRLEVFRG